MRGLTVQKVGKHAGLLKWLIAALVIGAVGSARADDRWTDPYPGVRHLHRFGSSRDIHILLVDLSNPAVSVVATRPEDRYTRVSEFARRTGSVIAINANYYGAGSCGLAAGGGTVWQDSYADGCDMSLGFGQLNEAVAFESFDVPRGPLPEAWMTDVVTGKPWLMRDGVVQGGWIRPRHIHGRHPRTAVGLTRDRRTLIILVGDGRRRGIAGLTGYELADLMVEFGAWDALNLDGGGSSELYMRPVAPTTRGSWVVNQPSDGRERVVVNHLGIRVNPAAAWYAARLDGASPAPTIAPGGQATVWARFVNVGRMPWRADLLGARFQQLASADRPSGLGASVQRVIPLDESESIAPGGSVTFELLAVAPDAVGTYPHAFAPVLDGALLSSPASWQVRVVEGAPRVQAFAPEPPPPLVHPPGGPTASVTPAAPHALLAWWRAGSPRTFAPVPSLAWRLFTN